MLNFWAGFEKQAAKEPDPEFWDAYQYARLNPWLFANFTMDSKNQKQLAKEYELASQKETAQHALTPPASTLTRTVAGAALGGILGALLKKSPMSTGSGAALGGGLGLFSASAHNSKIEPAKGVMLLPKKEQSAYHKAEGVRRARADMSKALVGVGEYLR